MDDTSLFEKSYIRRYFYIAMIALIVSLGSIRYLVLPALCRGECNGLTLSPTMLTASLIDNLLPALLASFGLSIFWFWLMPPVQKTAAIDPIEARLIGDVLENARSNTTHWNYKGGTGTYLRSVTLPGLAKYARQKKAPFEITIEILDPTNEKLCNLYAHYRESVAASNRQNQWTGKRTKLESYATILLACIYKAEEPLLNIRLGLSQTMTTFRYDIASDFLIITNEDPRAPALRINYNTFFYETYRDDIKRSLEQSKMVLLENTTGIHKGQATIETVRNQFELLGINDPLSDDDISQIIEKSVHAKNPY
jgi:hypothetical protein